MKTEKIKFLRFGNLGSYIQHYTANPELLESEIAAYHSPPARKGCYAFPQWYYFDFWLLGATKEPGNASGKSAWLTDKNGNYFEFNTYEEAEQHEKEIFAALKRSNAYKRYYSLVRIPKKEYCYCRQFKLSSDPDKCVPSSANFYFSRDFSETNLVDMTPEERKKFLDSYEECEEKLSKFEKFAIEKMILDKRILSDAPPPVYNTDFIEELWNVCQENSTYRVYYLKRPKFFEYTGEIWSHLEQYAPNNAEIIKRHGSWIKTDYKTYCEIFKKMYHIEKEGWLKSVADDYEKMNLSKSEILEEITLIQKVSMFKSIRCGKSTDFLEVFIEKI